MAFQLSISGDKTKHLNGPALAELEKAVEQFTEDLVAEAGRLESNVRSGAGDPEITSSMVLDAVIFLRHHYAKPRQHWFLRTLKIFNPVAGIMTGLMANEQFLKGTIHIAVFIAMVALTVASTATSVAKD